MQKKITLHSKLIAFSVITAFLLNAAFALFIASNVSLADFGVFDGKVIICTSDGIKLVSLEEYQNGDYQGDENKNGHCPLCVVKKAQLDKFNPTPSKFIFAQAKQESKYNYIADSYFSLKLASGNVSRAPPYFL